MIGFYDMVYDDIGSISTDGAQELVVGTNGVVAQIQAKNPRVIGTRYVLHLQNLAAQVLIFIFRKLLLHSNRLLISFDHRRQMRDSFA